MNEISKYDLLSNVTNVTRQMHTHSTSYASTAPIFLNKARLNY